MSRNQRSYDAVFKSKVALEAVKGEKTISQLSSEYGVHGNLIGQWRKHLIAELPSIFSDRCKKSEKEGEELIWRSVKYEEVYLNDYQDVGIAKESLGRYFKFYNTERLHQSLDYLTPTEVYYKERFDLRERRAA